MEVSVPWAISHADSRSKQSFQPRELISLIRLLYFTTSYPSVSHTFIRREIQQLERTGHDVFRVAIRTGAELVDDCDLSEQRKTCVLLNQSAIWLLLSLFHGSALSRLRVVRTVAAAIRMGRNSDRGVLRHLAYVVEALILRSYSRRNATDHTHVHFGTNVTSVALFCRMLGGSTYSFTVHGPDEFDAPRQFALSDKVHGAEFVVAISSYCKAQLMRWATVSDWRKIHVVRCSVDGDWYLDSSSSPRMSDDLLTVGRLAPQKGQLVLLEAFWLATQRGFPGNLAIVGDGEMKQELLARTEELGLEARVKFLGWQSSDQIRKHLQSCRALVLSSFAEGLPVVLMEAMAMGRPVIATRIAGIPELVDSLVGFPVVAGDAESLANAIMKVGTASDRDLTLMGRRAKERVQAMHDVSAETEKLAALFQRVPINRRESENEVPR